MDLRERLQNNLGSSFCEYANFAIVSNRDHVSIAAKDTFLDINRQFIKVSLNLSSLDVAKVDSQIGIT